MIPYRPAAAIRPGDIVTSYAGKRVEIGNTDAEERLILIDELAQAIITSGENTAERCWRLPMPEDSRELLKSDLADINNNSSSRYGGAIAAAIFLSKSIGDQRWAHIDIAGPAFVKKGPDYSSPGAKGFGVRLLCDLIDGI